MNRGIIAMWEKKQQRRFIRVDCAWKNVNTDELVHTARSSSACFPVFQCTLSAA